MKLELTKKTWLRLLLLPLLLYSFYLAKLPIEIIIIFGLFFLLIILFRTHFYDKIEFLLGEKFPVIHDWHPWQKKAIIIIVFILIYTVIKQLLYFSMDFFFGLNIEKMVLESMNYQSFE
ncbi:MAG: hypothetical protein ABH986_05310 [archaeon]